MPQFNEDSSPTQERPSRATVKHVRSDTSAGGTSSAHSRRGLLTSGVVLGGLAGCAGPNGEPSPSALPTTSGATETGTHATDTQTPGPREIPIVEPSNEKLALEPPFPETKREIADYREQVLSDHYEKHGNPESDEPTRIASIQELATKAQEDDVHVKMDPGTYPVTIDNYADILEEWTGPWDNPRAILFHFSGSNSYYDLRDVTITVETRLFNRFPEVLDVDGSETGFEDVVMSGSDSIIRGVTVEDVEGEWAGHPARTARTLNEWGGTRNLLQLMSDSPHGLWRCLQSHAEAIIAYLALPECSAEGRVSGLQARLEFEVDPPWNDHELDPVVV